MEKKIMPELKKYKEEYDFLHKKIGELEWEIATIYYGKKAILMSEKETLEERLGNYKDNMCILIENIKQEVTKINTYKQEGISSDKL